MSDLVRRAAVALVSVESREIRIHQRRVGLALAYEDGDATIRDRRIENGYALAHHTAVRATALNTSISEMCHDNPALEMGLRRLEQLTLGGATAIVAESFL